MRKIYLLFFLVVCSASSFANCGSSFPIIQKPILFNKERIQLTQSYRQQHYGINSKSITIIPKMIVLHWTTHESLQESYAVLYPVKIYDRPYLAKESQLNVSAHYLVDRIGTIYQLMPDNWMARHVIGLNNIAIGIENVGGVNNSHDLTDQQVAANAYLSCFLKKKYPTIKYLIGHYEYLKFRNTPLWQEKDPHYLTPKNDPGEEFVTKVRNRVKNLHLRSHY